MNVELEEGWIPSIFDGPAEQASPFFNTVKIELDGRVQADLNWKLAYQQAEQALQQGYSILWEINLGLFSALPFSLTFQSQYLSLKLCLEHFRDTLWKEFAPKSLGLTLYRGEADFSQHFKWDDQQIANLQEWLQEIFSTEELFEKEMGLSGHWLSNLNLDSFLRTNSGRHLASLFCRNVALEYLNLLANSLPDTLPRYLFLDVSRFLHSPLWQAQLLHPECFDAFRLAIRGNSFVLPGALDWESPQFIHGYVGRKEALQQKIEPSLGVCLPSVDMYCPSHYQGLNEALITLIHHKIPFRLIPEAHLITEWDGLDDLIYTPAGLSSQGKRKLQGFCAAQGRVITLREKMGLADEIDFNDWLILLSKSE